jgi:tetratricopeptide (TPR) repeat protein
MYIAIAAVVFASLPFAAISQTTSASVEAMLERYRSEPGNALLCEQIGVAYTRINDFNKAADFFRKAVELDPGRTSAQKNLATILWFLGRKDESATIFRSLERRIPKDPVPHLYLGLSAYDQKNMEAAAAHFQEAGALASENPETFPIVIESYISAGRSEPAVQLLERRIDAGNSDAQTYRWLGDAYNAAVQPDKAFRAYSEAVTRQPEAEDNYLALAAFSIEHANPSFAREILSRGLQHAPNSAKLLLEFGLAWALQGDFNKARQSFADANSAGPEWSLPLLALGVTDLQTGDATGAADCFRKAENIAPDDYRCYYLHAVALNRSETNHDPSTRATAISELRRAIELDPRQAKARVALADAEIADGQTSAAEAELRRAIRIDPTESSAIYKLALLCQREGKAQEARRLLRLFQQSKNKSESEENEFVLILKVLK